MKSKIIECCEKVVQLEDNFIDLAFELGPVEGMEPSDIKKYIRYIVRLELNQLKLDPFIILRASTYGSGNIEWC